MAVIGVTVLMNTHPCQHNANIQSFESNGKKPSPFITLHYITWLPSLFDLTSSNTDFSLGLKVLNPNTLGVTSVTRLGNLLDFGELFKVFGQLICPNLSHS